MKLLAEKGADLEKQDIHGDTPFGKKLPHSLLSEL